MIVDFARYLVVTPSGCSSAGRYHLIFQLMASLLGAFVTLRCAYATPVVEVAISSDVVAEGIINTFSQHSVGPSISTGTLTVISAHGNAQLDGTVTYGFIDGSESVATSQGRATADFFGAWQDGLTVTSPTLAQGAPVQLLATMTYDLNTFCNGGLAPTVSALTAFNVGVSPQLLVSTSTCNATLVGTRQELVSTFIGAVLQLEGQLSLGATDGAGGSAGTDPPASFYIDSVSPEVSYTTLSGTNYATPAVPAVPEPAEWALLGAGLLFMSEATRRGFLSWY